MAEEDSYGGGGGEDFRGRREYDGDEVEAVNLFLTDEDGSSSGARSGSSSEGSRVERGKCNLRRVRGIYSRGEKPLARGKWMNVPLTLLILATCVAHVQCGGDRG